LTCDHNHLEPTLKYKSKSNIKECIRNVLKEGRDTDKIKVTYLVFCDLSTPKGDGSFNVYDDMKQKLMAQGVPREEIAFIHDAKTEAISSGGDRKSTRLKSTNVSISYAVFSLNKKNNILLRPSYVYD